ncbi:hypothetical protein C7U54_00045 [Faecalibacillus intestinalis]|uniref:DUF4268 domain-containing protein n=1 Tax=Faecalibacillus intestinalis TaxID=1982626 RepID=A0A2T3G6M1_9FIRM|nr:DUF4268 domain-containing protein [Faecalibacillus intestinalis]PST43142.1 hypothetical protein C7U54_00045 [Faecalibacillus intestinalis]
MKGSELRLIEYMEGSKKRFIIPVYQRNYDWKIENCKQLYDDLIQVIKNNSKTHFFGSIVSVYEPSGRNTEFLIIDGQQRLTTMSLLFLALYNLLEEKIIISEDESLKDQIYEDFLVDKYQPQEKRMKLKPIKNDQKAFSKLFNSKDDYIKDSNLTINYSYFYERIQKQEITIDELFDAICRLEIINITLNNEDNPQLIFESLNSTGLDLSEGDKIRNYILMGLPKQKQDEYYEKYWNCIEKCTKYDVSSFIRDYLSVKQLVIPSQKKVYINFKKYVEDSSLKIIEILEDLLSYAKRYNILLCGKTSSKELNSCINRLNRLETTVTRPFFLEVLRLYDENQINLNEVTEAFSITESYLFRRTICDLPTNALNKIFLLLNREIMRYDGTDSNYIEKLKFALLSKKDRARFPNDDDFSLMFTEKPIYQMNSKNKIYILERLENFGTLEDKDIYRHYDEGEYSIEHIMPQHLTPAWIKELGDSYEEIHDTWLHRIANLTLTAYNSKYSNSTFVEKKTMKNGFEDSGIRLNTYVSKKDKWTLAELRDRNDYLLKRALDIWAFPSTNYKPQEKQLDSYTLDDEASFLSGRQIAKFVYKGIEQPVVSWVEMYTKVLRALYLEDKTIITKIALSTDDDLSIHFSTNKRIFKKCDEIGDNVYVQTNTNTQSKLSVLNRLYKLYGMDPTDLVFYLRDSNDKEAEKGTRFEIRRRYWGYALKFIKEENFDNKSFDNVNTSKENWINGTFGIGGFAICCIANYDFARVDVYFGKTNANENKIAFDNVMLHKLEIESNLGVNLEWDRGDDVKRSIISYRLENVSIYNENDWLQIAKFHAKWSKKFIDAIVPYLK